MLGVIARERKKLCCTPARCSLPLSFSRQSKTISCQSTKRDEERESGVEWRSLSQFAEYDVERDGTSMDVMMLCRAEEKENEGEK